MRYGCLFRKREPSRDFENGCFFCGLLKCSSFIIHNILVIFKSRRELICALCCRALNVIAHPRASNAERRHLPCSIELQLECRCLRKCGNLHLLLMLRLFRLCFLLLFAQPLSLSLSTLVLLHCPLFLLLSISLFICSHRLLLPFPPC